MKNKLNILENSNSIFEIIRHLDKDGNEYWEARELQKVLEYNEWRNFNKVIEKAKIACNTSKNEITNHFVEVNKMVDIGSSAKRKQKDYKLSRYACYLIALAGDERKEVIALAKSYFAIQTRRMEILDSNYELMTEDERRLYNRKLTKKENKSLNQTAAEAGVKNFPYFTNLGYKGLYNGETARDIAERKGLKYREEILDNMCSEELSANLFRISQTEAKIKREKLKGSKEAGKAHYEVGQKVRKTIKDLGGTMPEDLPTPNKNIKYIEKEKNNKKTSY